MVDQVGVDLFKQRAVRIIELRSNSTILLGKLYGYTEIYTRLKTNAPAGHAQTFCKLHAGTVQLWRSGPDRSLEASNYVRGI